MVWSETEALCCCDKVLALFSSLFRVEFLVSVVLEQLHSKMSSQKVC